MSSATEEFGADTWDFCHPPDKVWTTRFKTQRGCECLDEWGTSCEGSTMKDGTPGGRQQQFYRCGMDTPCDGDDNRAEKDSFLKQAFPTWCFVSKDCEEGIPGSTSGLGDVLDRHVQIKKRKIKCTHTGSLVVCSRGHRWA